MTGRFGHFGHVARVAALFGGGFTVFLVVRWALIPPDFGAYGFYRAGALTDIRAQPIVYAGEAPCLDCHGDVAEIRLSARHARIKCEACHGPLTRHATGDVEVKPRALNPRLLCLQCHTQSAGKPEGFPQIVASDHGADVACTDCHRPHRPKIE
jgi:hypothetical protein